MPTQRYDIGYGYESAILCKLSTFQGTKMAHNSGGKERLHRLDLSCSLIQFIYILSHRNNCAS